MRYRREIDGLRAVAVLPVIFFHAGFEFFSGGYIGVDVFFVISGYLITTIILTEKNADKFSVINFYERRARRIMPALLFVMLSCLPFAWFWMAPSQLIDFSQSLVAVSLFISNIFFWRESGYFEVAAELKPLLHTWSLAVEEQYYLLFPLFILLAWRFGKRRIVAMLVFIGLTSIALAQWGSVSHPAANFYLLPTRLWELLLGSLTAFYLLNHHEKPGGLTEKAAVFDQSASAFGLLLIFYAIFTFDDQTPFPGFYALVPTLGTALIILFASEKTMAGRFLSNKIFVGIGLISYSAYLWHQPLYAFARIRNIDIPSETLMFVLGVLSLVLSFFTWKYVEKPFRRKQKFSRKNIFQGAFAGSLFICTIGIIGHFGNGFTEARFTESQIELLSFLNYDKDPIYRSGSCFLAANQNYPDFENSCVSSDGSGPSIFIWGDSHAAALSSGIRATAESVAQFSTTQCPPVLDFISLMSPNCPDVNTFVLAEIDRLQPEIILLHANWYLYRSVDLNPRLTNTIMAIKKVNPEGLIYVVGGVPQWPNSLPEFLLSKRVELNAANRAISPMYEEIADFDTKYQSVTKDSDVEFLSLLEVLCNPDGCRSVIQTKNGYEPTAWDRGHLTEYGSLFVADKILPKLTRSSSR